MFSSNCEYCADSNRHDLSILNTFFFFFLNDFFMFKWFFFFSQSLIFHIMNNNLSIFFLNIKIIYH